MSCYFCDSSYHLSHNCEIYASLEFKKLFILSKNLCVECLSPSNSKQFKCVKMCGTCFFKEGHSSYCNPNEEPLKCATKCGICFSEEHHSVFCTQKGNMLVPKIDHDLLPRFFKTLSIDEKYSMAFSTPKAFQFMPSKPLVVKKTLDYYTNMEEYQDCNFLANGIIDIAGARSVYRSLLNLLNQKSLITQSEKIKIRFNYAKFSGKLFWHLLASQTLALSLTDVAFDSKVEFSELLQRIPNIRWLFLKKTNIEIKDSWPETLMDLKITHDFMLKMTLSCKNFNFNVGVLAEFMKTKLDENGRIELHFSKPRPGIVKRFKKSLAEFFVPKSDNSSSLLPELKIIVGKKRDQEECIYVCKEDATNL